MVAALYAYGVVLTGRRRYAVLLVLTIAGLGLVLGTLWEFAEWVYGGLDLPRSELHRTFTKWDTLMDLVMDLLGAAVAGILSLVMIDKERPPSLD